MSKSLAVVLFLALSGCGGDSTSTLPAAGGTGAGGSGGSGPVGAGGVQNVVVSSIALSAPHCLPRQLPADANTSGKVRLVAARPMPCDCSATGRRDADSSITAAVRSMLAGNGVCSPADCSAYCVCELLPAAGSALDLCLNQPDPLPASAVGWCYVSPDQGLGSADLVSACGAMRQLLRVLGTVSPPSGESWFMTMES
jgi:hypothetical protein